MSRAASHASMSTDDDASTVTPPSAFSGRSRSASLTKRMSSSPWSSRSFDSCFFALLAVGSKRSTLWRTTSTKDAFSTIF